MNSPTRVTVALVMGALLAGAPALATEVPAVNDSKVREGAQQVQRGGKHIGGGIADTAQGVGKTIVGGAETAGEKIREAGEAAEPEVKTAWTKVRSGAVTFGRSVKNFFTRLFSD